MSCETCKSLRAETMRSLLPIVQEARLRASGMSERRAIDGVIDLLALEALGEPQTPYTWEKSLQAVRADIARAAVRNQPDHALIPARRAADAALAIALASQAQVRAENAVRKALGQA